MTALMDEPVVIERHIDFDPCPPHLRHYRDAVNRERKLHNLSPLQVLPKGNVRCARSCVVARALHATAVGKAGSYIKNGSNHYTAEALILQLVERFDNGLIPELIDG